MTIPQSNSNPEATTSSEASSAPQGRRADSGWIRWRFGLLLLMIAAWAVYTSAARDLSAGTDLPSDSGSSIRLRPPSFSADTVLIAGSTDEQPMPGMQIVPRMSAIDADSPVVQSRQLLNTRRPLPPYSDRARAQIGSVSATNGYLVPDRSATAINDVGDHSTTIPTAPVSRNETWTRSVGQAKVLPDAIHHDGVQRENPEWSIRPEKIPSTPSTFEREFQALPDQGWSLMPDEDQVAEQIKSHDRSVQPTTPPPHYASGIRPPTAPSLLAPTVPSDIGQQSVIMSQLPRPTDPVTVDHDSVLTEPATPQPRSQQPTVPNRGLILPQHNGSETVTLPGFPPYSGSHGSATPFRPMPDGVYSQELPVTRQPFQFPEYPAEPLIPFNQHMNDQSSAGGNYPGHSSGQSAPAIVGGHSIFGIQPGTSGFRATVERDAAQWMSPYNSRADLSGGYDMTHALATPLAALPRGFAPWWDASVRQSTGIAASSIPVEVGQLLQDALLYSPQVIAIKAEPEVQYRVVTQEAAKFDWTVFLDTTYDDLNDPVGNELTTGNGQDRLIVRKVTGEGGLRQKNLMGGELELSQRVGHENQNSRFFIPNNQAATRLELSYRQPLLDGAGRCYNESEIILARIRANSSEDEVVDALQGHLIEVTKAYWTLYRARAEFFQRQKLLATSQSVLLRLEGRSQVDTIPRQVLRARAAVARAQTRIQRTVARVKDAEAQLRLLVNSPGMLNGGPIELTPTEAPRMITESADLRSVLQTALLNRPDISEAIRKMRASSVRLGVSKTELLPRLDFLVETYVADLSGNSNLRRAVNGQFYDNRPGYTVGFEFEYPIENRAARAKMEQRQWELKRSINVFRATVEKSLTDVEISNREVATAYSEMLSRFQSMQAAENETTYLQDRFDVLPASEDSAVLLLEDLLDSYERIADEESSFVQAQVDHAVALVILKKELGILLQSRHSRPDVEQGDQQWIENRLDSAFDIPQQELPNNSGTRIVGTEEELFYDRPSGRSRPIPATPAAWSRP